MVKSAFHPTPQGPVPSSMCAGIHRNAVATGALRVKPVPCSRKSLALIVTRHSFLKDNFLERERG